MVINKRVIFLRDVAQFPYREDSLPYVAVSLETQSYGQRRLMDIVVPRSEANNVLRALHQSSGLLDEFSAFRVLSTHETKEEGRIAIVEPITHPLLRSAVAQEIIDKYIVEIPF